MISAYDRSRSGAAAVLIFVFSLWQSSAWNKNNKNYQANAFVILPHSLHPTIGRPINGAAAVYMSEQRSLEEILLELDRKGILFSPTATKSELEALLLLGPRSTNRNRTTTPKNINRENDDSFKEEKRSERRRTRRESPEMASQNPSDDDYRNERELRRRRRQRRQSRPLSSPKDTLLRVVNKTTKTVARIVVLPEPVVDLGSKAARIASRKAQQLFNELVDLTYEDLDVPVLPVRSRAPTNDKNRRRTRARRKEADLDRSHAGVESDSSPSNDYLAERKVKITENEPEDTIPPFETKTVPIREVLSELDAMNIRYSVQATREDLENLLNHAKNFKEDSSFPPGTESTKDISSLEIESEVTGASTFYADKPALSWDEEPLEEGIWSPTTSRVDSTRVKSVPKTMSDAVRKGACTTSRTYGKAQASVIGLFQDESLDKASSGGGGGGTTPQIIVDAVVEDFSKTRGDHAIIDIQPTYRESWSTISPETRSSGRPGRSVESRDKLGRKRRPLGPDINFPRVDNFSNPKRKRNIVTPSDISRPGPANNDSPEPNTRKGPGSGKRIYSPYHTNKGDESFLNVDGLDQLGSFVSRSVDSFLWGPEDETEGSSPSSSDPQQPAFEATGRRKRSSHWKDRLEERFDFLLGIHQDGQYYNRWMQRDREDMQDEEGADALSYARGRAPQPGRKRRISERPIWEEEDSLLSMLFGTDKKSKHRNGIFYRPASFFASGSLVKLLQTILRSGMLLLGGVSRWASVRGSLPQPVVVVGILSAALSSRPGSRIRNVFLALVVIRAAGELLHGYMYDDSDFWEPKEDGRNERAPETE